MRTEGELRCKQVKHTENKFDQPHNKLKIANKLFQLQTSQTGLKGNVQPLVGPTRMTQGSK